jgi:hypothetical protein
VTGAPLADVDAESVPQDDEEQVTVQVTPLFAKSFVTVAVSGTAAPGCTVAVPGTTETLIPGMVTFADAVATALETEVAVMVTAKSPTGCVLGAV